MALKVHEQVIATKCSKPLGTAKGNEWIITGNLWDRMHPADILILT